MGKESEMGSETEIAREMEMVKKMEMVRTMEMAMEMEMKGDGKNGRKMELERRSNVHMRETRSPGLLCYDF